MIRCLFGLLAEATCLLCWKWEGGSCSKRSGSFWVQLHSMNVALTCSRGCSVIRSRVLLSEKRLNQQIVFHFVKLHISHLFCFVLVLCVSYVSWQKAGSTTCSRADSIRRKCCPSPVELFVLKKSTLAVPFLGGNANEHVAIQSWSFKFKVAMG